VSTLWILKHSVNIVDIKTYSVNIVDIFFINKRYKCEECEQNSCFDSVEYNIGFENGPVANMAVTTIEAVEEGASAAILSSITFNIRPQ
jgi:hypothetical protein